MNNKEGAPMLASSTWEKQPQVNYQKLNSTTSKKQILLI
jgi:hypothetical protein